MINNIDISTFNQNDYFNLFSAVFQDYSFLPTSILSNITMTEDADEATVALVREALDKAGLLEKIDKLPQKLQTNLMKQINDDAVDFSVGEKQKLLFARALYKNAPILILDEPSAALDPIAEEKLYSQYHSITQGVISLYISHRLSSTQFCDRIFLFRDGRIIESGSHKELLQAKGEYHEMFLVQGCYYQDEVKQ